MMVTGLARRALLRALLGAPLAAAAKDIVRASDILDPSDTLGRVGEPAPAPASHHDIWNAENDSNQIAMMSWEAARNVSPRYECMKSWSAQTKVRATYEDMLRDKRSELARRRWFKALHEVIGA